jgi:hypothetical protein
MRAARESTPIWVCPSLSAYQSIYETCICAVATQCTYLFYTAPYKTSCAGYYSTLSPISTYALKMSLTVGLVVLRV